MLPTALTLLLGCALLSPSDVEDALDPDGDGWAAAADCAPLDAERPGQERPYDGVDNDCDASTPDDDLDGDGIDAGEDCDDADPEVFPGAEDPCGDGIDRDCSDVCARTLGDGPRADGPEGARVGSALTLLAAPGGRTHVAAGAPGMDGVAGEAGAVWLFEADSEWGPLIEMSDAWHLDGDAAGDELGTASAFGDVDGDGEGDLVVGAPRHDTAEPDGGAVYVVAGPLDAAYAGPITTVSRATLLGAGGLGEAVVLLHLGGDTLLAAGAPTRVSGSGGVTGAVSLYTTPLLDTPAADWTLDGHRLGEEAGAALHAADLDGDGDDALIVGAPAASDGPGRVYVVAHSLGADGALAGVAVLLEGASTADRFGTALVTGDTNADGYVDLLVGAPRETYGGSRSGSVYLLLGAGDGTLAGQARFDGTTEAQVGTALLLADDLDGDDRVDLVAGAPTMTVGGASSGGVWVIGADATGVVSLAERGAALLGEAPGDSVGASLAGSPDVGLLLGARLADEGGEAGGAVYRVWGTDLDTSPLTSGGT